MTRNAKLFQQEVSMGVWNYLRHVSYNSEPDLRHSVLFKLKFHLDVHLKIKGQIEDEVGDD